MTPIHYKRGYHLSKEKGDERERELSVLLDLKQCACARFFIASSHKNMRVCMRAHTLTFSLCNWPAQGLASESDVPALVRHRQSEQPPPPPPPLFCSTEGGRREAG